eukprot:79512_1
MSEYGQTKTDEEQKEDNKYVSNYGFGVTHEYHRLEPIYDSIYDELMYNTQSPIPKITFYNLLTKAINLRNVKLEKNDNKNRLICKYFDAHYKIPRNEPISIHHMLAVVIYTDLTKLCTNIRQTYRNINNELDYQVTKRHREFYQFSRALYECIEFFGQPMGAKVKVYHGLNSEITRFDQFTAFFNQPLSTTDSFSTAQEFSRGVGIILALKCGTNRAKVTSKVPKYMPVAWVSDFPNEREKLFHGSYNIFQIYNITQAINLKGHLKELKIFNKFQRLLQNENVTWHNDESNDLAKLIECQQHYESDDKKFKTLQKKLVFLTDYGQSLFNHFFTNKNITPISLPRILSNKVLIFVAI